jgi:hypothetical protein
MNRHALLLSFGLLAAGAGCGGAAVDVPAPVGDRDEQPAHREPMPVDPDAPLDNDEPSLTEDPPPERDPSEEPAEQPDEEIPPEQPEEEGGPEADDEPPPQEEPAPPADPTEEGPPPAADVCQAGASPELSSTCPFASELVIYGQEGWSVLSDALAAGLSDCTHAYVSIPPRNDDKTKLRENQAALMHARGPRMHAMAEFHFTTWNQKRLAEGLSWKEIGAQFREEMLAKGFCVEAGDTWAINEAPSTLRREASFRAGFAELLEGLAEGRPGMPLAKGAVFVVGFGHRSENVSVYKTNIKATLQDAALWTRANNAVRFWGQETYVDATHTCIADANQADRRRRVNQYAMHVHRLSVAAPDAAGVNTAQSFLGRAYVPVVNAVWDAAPERGYGDTRVSLTQMDRFIRMQVDAIRNYASANAAPDGRIGFAFASYHDPQEWQALGESIASAVGAAYGEGGVAADACGDAGCTCTKSGAAENPLWAAFSTW